MSRVGITRKRRRNHQFVRRNDVKRSKWLPAVAVASACIVALGVTAAVDGHTHSAGVRAQIVFTSATANDASIAIPEGIKAYLKDIARAGGKIAIDQVDSTSSVEISELDLTPRADAGGPPLKVEQRASDAIEQEITALETVINGSVATTGNRALFAGLLKLSFDSHVPVVIFSTGLDLSDPVDARKLGFDIPPEQVVDSVRRAGELPSFHGAPVTFVLTPPAGSQEQLREPQRQYLQDVWSALLRAGGASDVTFVDARGGPSLSTTEAPVVPLPALPGTPIAPQVMHPGDTTCSLPTTSYFRPNSAELVDAALTRADLTECVMRAGPNTLIEIDSFTAYFGPVDAVGRPLLNPPFSIELSNARNETIATVLIGMGIDRARITRMAGHGSDSQPYAPDPGSAKNRVSVITFRDKAK